MSAQLDIDREKLAAFCRRHHVRKLSFFGSVLRDDFTEESDVDVLVEFEPGERVGFFRLFEVEDELSRLLGRKADLLTPGFFRPRLREKILKEAEVQYAAA